MSQTASLSDAYFMHRAIELAYENLGSVSPNPSVGAVIVRNGEIIAEGKTHPPGGLHAETDALKKCKDARGATLFVTLEPCCHENKRTVPCCPEIVRAGISRVVIGILDPHPSVNGKGVAMLRAAGIDVTLDVAADEVRQCHEFYLKWVQEHRPFVTLKAAMTRNGAMTWGDSSRKKITGDESQVRVHALRAQHDSIMVGVDTVLKDDPLLTNRLGGRNPIRIILDSRLRISPSARIFAQEGANIVICTANHDATKRAELSQLADIIVVNDLRGHVDVREALEVLGELSITSVLAEAGPTLATALIQEKIPDKVMMFIAPFTKEGSGFLSALGEVLLRDVTEESLGDDLLVQGYIGSVL